MKRAIALLYEAEMHEAPVVVYCGEGEVAESIERAARDYGVAVVRDVPLAHALSELQSGEAIPDALYEAVAAVLGSLSSSQSG
jgi:flagellar biosynthesis protein